MYEFLDDTQSIAIDSFSRMLRDEIVPAVAPHVQKPLLPKDVIVAQLRRLAEFGLGNGRVAVEDGGMGLDLMTAGLLYEEACRQCFEVGAWAFINEGCATAIAALASPQLKERYLAKLLAGEIICASANTEPDGGSDVRSIRTKAMRDGDSYVISGRKQWITNAPHCDLMLVFARTDDSDRQDFYLLDMDEHSVENRPLVTNGTITTSEILLDAVRVPAENRLTGTGPGLNRLLDGFQRGRIFVALSAVGLAQAAFEEALQYAKDRTQFGAPIAAKQLIQGQLADCATEIEAARLLCYHALRLADAERPYSLAASKAKLFASEMAKRVTERACQIHGGAGLCPEYRVERTARHVRMMTIVEGTSEIQRLIIGRELTGISAF